MPNTGVIYQITNHQNGKVSIGCTSDFASRIKSHINAAIQGKTETKLYRDMRKDITNFSFRILEAGVSISMLRQKESEWIVNKKSVQNGYNVVRVSGKEKLTEELLHEIREAIQSTKFKFCELAKLYDVQPATIADINLGRAWLDDKYEYPLRKNTVKRKKLTEADVKEIYILLKNNNLSFQEIASQYGWKSEAVLRKINNGTYSISPLPKDAYPIRPVDSRKGIRKR